MNMFARTAGAFDGQRDQALAALRRATFVASDETGVRIEGVNAFHWVFRCQEAVVHTAEFTRAAEVVRQTMGGWRPRVWTSDRYRVTNGYRAGWTAHYEAAVRTAVDTARLTSASPFQTILQTIAP